MLVRRWTIGRRRLQSLMLLAMWIKTPGLRAAHQRGWTRGWHISPRLFFIFARWSLRQHVMQLIPRWLYPCSSTRVPLRYSGPPGPTAFRRCRRVSTSEPFSMGRYFKLAVLFSCP
ncbi:hypothetical protein BD414DRAFT_481806 [Trametes punicea]|nr:hypothetical protein BD414DRAFT_481806 [Trametes punicea]